MENTSNVAEPHSVEKIVKRNKTSSFGAYHMICIRGKPDS